MTGGRLHHDIRHSSPPPFVTLLLHVLSFSLSCRSAPSRPPPLFLALSVTLPFEVSVLLPTAGAEAVTTIIVSEVTSLKHREEEKEHRRWRRRRWGGGHGARAREGERADWPIYRTGNKHRAAGVDPSGYRRVYTAPVISSREVALRPLRTTNIHFFPGTTGVQRADCRRETCAVSRFARKGEKKKNPMLPSYEFNSRRLLRSVNAAWNQ